MKFSFFNIIKRLCFFIIFFSLPSLSQALEDYTTFTEVDEQGDIAITSSTLITLTTIRKDADSYVYKDYGVNFFSGNFAHDVTVSISSSNGSTIGPWAISNNFNAWDDLDVDNDNGIGVRYYERVANDWEIEIYDFATEAVDRTSDLGESTFYLTIQRYLANPGQQLVDKCKVRIYSDAARTILVDTLSITCSDTSFRYLHAFVATGSDTTNADIASGTVSNLNLSGTLVPELDESIINRPTSPYPADHDFKGGYTGVTANQPIHFERYWTYTDNFVLYDSTVTFPTVPINGYDLVGARLRPDINSDFIFNIDHNLSKTIFIQFPDRLWNNVVVNGSMEVDATWVNYNTPSTNALTSTGTNIPYWMTTSTDHQVFSGTKERHVVGNANDGIEQTGLDIDTLASDCVTDITNWTDKYESVGHILVVSGTVFLQIIDGDGTTQEYNAQVGATNGLDGDGNRHWQSWKTGYFTSTYSAGCGSGIVRLYCSGGDCEFYVDNVTIGEVERVNAANDTVGILDFNHELRPYVVYGRWRVERHDDIKRMVLIDPLDNMYIRKGSNNHDFNQIKGRHGGNTPCGHFKNLKNSVLSCTSVTQLLTPEIYDVGLNGIGFFLADETITNDPDATFTIINQADMTFWTDGTDAAGQINFADSNFDGYWFDTYDVDYDNEILERINSTLSKSYGDVDATYASTDNNNYYFIQNKLRANINLIGYVLGNEPHGAGSGWPHLVVRLLQSDLNGTTSPDGRMDTKAGFINYLRSKYGNSGTEGTFLTNIGYGGASEITLAGTFGWTGVAGYDSTDGDSDGTPDKDEDAITAMNNAWGTTCPNQNASGQNEWYEFMEDSFYTHCTGIGTQDGDNWLVGADAEVYEDWTELLANYQRKFQKGLYDTLYGPSGRFKRSFLNMGFGHGFHEGWFKGVKSPDGATQYLDLVSMRDIQGLTNDGPTYLTPYRNLRNDLTNTITLGTTIDRAWKYADVAYMHQSFWVSGEIDSWLGGDGGTVSEVFSTTGTTRMYMPGWNCDGLTASQCSTSAGTYILSEEDAVGWDCTDITNMATCTNTGTIDGQWSQTFHEPFTGAVISNRVWIYTEDTGTLQDNDIVTNGTKMLALTATPSAQTAVCDETANFNSTPDNPMATWNLFQNTTFYNVSHMLGENGHASDSNPSDGINATIYYKLHGSANTRRCIGADQSYFHVGAGEGNYDVTPNYADQVKVGDRYEIGFMEPDAKIWYDQFYLMDTQEKRAKAYCEVVDQMMSYETTEGIRPVIGIDFWAIMSDYGCEDDGSIECRNFGVYDPEHRMYDGESSPYGGNFVYGFKKCMDEIYVKHD